MPSQLRSDTARANGAKSRGPKTPAGKAVFSRNALRHGFTARHTVVLATESEDQFQELQREFNAIHSPATPEEQDMVNEMLAARWRIQRLRAAEVVVVDAEMVAGKPEIEKKFVEPPPALHFGLVLRGLAAELAHFSRHESRLQRDFHRSYRTLRELRHNRTASEPEPPRPVKPSGGNRLQAVPAPHEQKNGETNPAVPPSLQRAVDRHFAKLVPVPDFSAMEVLNRSYGDRIQL